MPLMRTETTEVVEDCENAMFGCTDPAEHYDDEGVALCQKHWDDLLSENG